MIFVDSNIPMYLVGAPHALKQVAAERLKTLIQREEKLVCDAEVYQEILRRFIAIRRPEAIQPCFDLLNGIVEEVFPISHTQVFHAKTIIADGRATSARDAIHLAVMRDAGISEVLSFDRDFDRYPGITRIGA